MRTGYANPRDEWVYVVVGHDPNDSQCRFVKQKDWEDLGRQVHDAIVQCGANKNALDSSAMKKGKKPATKKTKKKSNHKLNERRSG